MIQRPVRTFNDVCNNRLLECRSTMLSGGSESIDLLELRRSIHWVDLEQQSSSKPSQSASCSGLVALDDIEHNRLSVEWMLKLSDGPLRGGVA